MVESGPRLQHVCQAAWAKIYDLDPLENIERALMYKDYIRVLVTCGSIISDRLALGSWGKVDCTALNKSWFKKTFLFDGTAQN